MFGCQGINNMDWFTSDFHFRHNNIVKYSFRNMFMSEEERKIVESGDNESINRLRISRETTDRMNDWFIDEVNRTVKKNDRLWVLGDFCHFRKGSSPSEICNVYKYYRDKMNCRNVCFVWGNHDPHVGTKARELVSGVFGQTYDKITIVVNGQRIHMNHEPVAIWDCRHYSSWHLYGHCHSGSESWLEQIMPSRFSIDVGVDNAYKILGRYVPFSFNDLKKIFDAKSGFGLIKSRR